jgi:hypothetical protein
MAVLPPSALAVQQSIQSVLLTWSASATSSVKYIVYRATGSNRNDCGFFVQVGGTYQLTWTDGDLQPGEVYYYKVIAVLDTDESSATNTVSLAYQGAKHQYDAIATSEDALTDRKGATTVARGVVPQGCSEYVRLQKLRGIKALV